MSEDGKWIGVDFDKVLAHYEDGDIEKYGKDYLGEPIPKMVNKVKEMLDEGEDVRIFSARAADANKDPRLKEVFDRWMEKNLGKILPMTNIKDHNVKVWYDDKARRIKANKGKRIK